MGERMTALSRTAKGFWRARKAIPKGAREDYRRLFGATWEAKLFLPADLRPAEAKARYGEWLAEVEARIEAILARQRGEAQGLTQRQARALSGEWYGWFTAPYAEAPGNPARWSADYGRLIDALADIDPFGMYGDGHSIDIDKVMQGNLPALRPLIADWANTAQFLASRGTVLTPQAMDSFLDYVAADYPEALALLQRRAKGDFSPDTLPGQFPRFTGPGSANSQTGPWALFEMWVKAKQPAPSTVNRWRTVFRILEDKFKDGISEDQVRDWARKLVTKHRSARTIADSWLGAAKAVYGWALAEKHIKSNPFAGVSITIPKKIRIRESKAFTDAEAALILRNATAILDKRPRRNSSASSRNALRWVPWLCAYSGARAGEITQLRGQDIAQRDGIWCMNLTPDAGTIKSRQGRLVPLHEHMIAQGFLDFVKARGKGPLFYDAAAKSGEDTDDPLNPKRPMAVAVRDQVAQWVRSLGIKDKELSPTHSWRHSFKQIADRCGISERVSDAITGHAPATVGRGYGAPTLADKAAALTKFPRYQA